MHQVILKFFSPLHKLHLQNRSDAEDSNRISVNNNCTRYGYVWRLYCLHAYLHTFATEKIWQSRCHSEDFHFPVELKQFFAQVVLQKSFSHIGKSCFTSFFGFPISTQRIDHLFPQKISWSERLYHFNNKSAGFIVCQCINMLLTTLKNSLKLIAEFIPFCIEGALVSGYSSALIYYRQSEPNAYLRHGIGVIAMSVLSLLYCAVKLTRVLTKTITSPVRSACEAWRLSKPLGVLSVCATIAAYIFLLPAILPAAAPSALGFLGTKFASAMCAIKVAFPFAGLSLTGSTTTAVGAHLTGEIATALTAFSFLKTSTTRPTPRAVAQENPAHLSHWYHSPSSVNSALESVRSASTTSV